MARCRGAIVTRHSTHVHTWRANRADSNVMEVAVKAVERRCILRAVVKRGRRPAALPPLCARSFYLLLQIRFTARVFFSSRERLRCLCFAATRVTERPIFPMVKSVRKADIIFHSVDSRCSSINLFLSTRCIDDPNGSTWRDNREYFKFLCIFRRIVNLFRVQVGGIPTVKCDCSRE